MITLGLSGAPEPGQDFFRPVSTMEEAAGKPSSEVVAVVGGGLVRKRKLFFDY